ncbi:BspA family leucine-rich repeat surface protein, partial [Enterococcus faecalis]|uniref:BspA family leucine-rich repeat surface protein n=1 Tax=Enterococcus faecalis TaxID=1351 RepID=UPI003D0BC112
SNFETFNVMKMNDMFADCSSLTRLVINSFDTSNVTNMSGMFNNCTKLTGLIVRNFNTSNVTRMTNMFAGCSWLIALDLSSFDTSNVTNMQWMFDNCNNLASLTLGAKFKMVDRDLLLPEIDATEKYTGKWQNIGTGTRENPNGTHIWTSAEFMTNYSGETDADTYVWQPTVKAADVTVEYVDEDNNKLVDNVVKTGNVGESYTTEQKDIPGYTFKEVKGNA